jgi:DNA invertase Pin-like site-specific DNA recombinase
LVYALDRFGRSVRHLVNALDEFKSLGIDFCAYNQNIDTTTASGKLFFTMISGFAEFEAAIIKERVHAGLARARAEGKTLGRPRTVQFDRQAVKKLRKTHSIRQIAANIGASKSSVQRLLTGKIRP